MRSARGVRVVPGSIPDVVLEVPPIVEELVDPLVPIEPLVVPEVAPDVPVVEPVVPEVVPLVPIVELPVPAPVPGWTSVLLPLAPVGPLLLVEPVVPAAWCECALCRSSRT